MHVKALYFLVILFILKGLELSGQNKILTPEMALEKALENNYQLIITGRDVEISRINNNPGTAGRYPSVRFDAGDSYSSDSEDFRSNRFSTSLGVNWVLFDGFRVNINKASLELQEEASEGILALTIENTIQDIILAYNNVLLQKETLKVFTSLSELSEDRYLYEIRKQELGGSVKTEVLQAKNIFLSDKAQVLKQEVEIRKAIRYLNMLMGEDIGEPWQIEGELKTDSTEYLLSELREKMLRNNRSLQNQYINIRLKEQAVKSRNADLFPSVNLGTGIQGKKSRTQNNGVDNNGNFSYGPYVNLNLSYTLYNGGNRKRSIEMAKIEEETTAIERDQLEQILSNELFTVYDNFELRKELVKIAEEALSAATLNLQIADEKFRTGAINSFNYRDIQLLFLSSALEHLSAKYNLIVSHSDLTRLTGGYLRDF